MRLYYWIEKYRLHDNLFKKETCTAYLTEAHRFQTNEDYYNQTNDPAIFVGVVYYKKPEIVLNALCKVVRQLKMPGIIDDIKTCVWAATDFSLGKDTLYIQRANTDLYRQTTFGKNNHMARIASMLFILRMDLPKGPRIAWALTKLILAYLKSSDANSKVMAMLRKEISFDVLEQCLVE